MAVFRRAVLAGAAVVALAGPAMGQDNTGLVQGQGMFPAIANPFTASFAANEDAPLAKLTPVTDAVLGKPSDADWLMWRRTYDGWGYSPLKQINKTNVKDLKLAWSWAMAPGAAQGTPLVHDGVLFVQSWGDGVEALNAATGDLLWRYSRRAPANTTITFKRMIALYEDKVLLATSDKHLIALDAKSGKVIWDTAVEGPGGFTSGPMALKGKAIIGATNCNTARCFITAHDIKTGKEVWRFQTVAAPGETGGDTWNGIPVEDRFGGSSWTSGAYDPGTGLLYWGVGQPYPWNEFARGTSKDNTRSEVQALYTNNTLALDPDTGKLKWNYSHLSNDSWDMDYVFERTLVDIPVKGQMRKLSVTSGKMAIIEGLDAKTGQFVFAKDLGLQNVVKSIDPATGAKTINPDVIPYPNKTVTICPHAGGARSVGATAYDPTTKTLFLPLTESCADMTAGLKAPGEKTAPSRFVLRLREGSDGNLGRLEAVNLATQKVAWTHRERAPQSTGSLPTAGGLVFQGGFDRYFKAYDSSNGKELWRTRLADMPNSQPISFSAGGKQYIAVTTGAGGSFTRTWGNLVQDLRNPPAGGAAVYVFELPEK